MTDELKKKLNSEPDDVVPTDEEGNPLKEQKQKKAVSFEVDDVVEEGETDKDTTKKLREELKKCVEEKQQSLADLQRAKADFINMRKRDEDEKKEFIKYAKAGLIEELIPVLDSFEMARANKEAWEKVEKNWRMGVEYINNQLLKTLEDNGLKVVDPKGEKFDPMRDEAVSYEPTSDEKLDHVIIEVIQKGYSLNGKILKAPRVKVSEYKTA